MERQRERQPLEASSPEALPPEVLPLYCAGDVVPKDGEYYVVNSAGNRLDHTIIALAKGCRFPALPGDGQYYLLNHGCLKGQCNPSIQGTSDFVAQKTKCYFPYSK